MERAVLTAHFGSVRRAYQCQNAQSARRTVAPSTTEDRLRVDGELHLTRLAAVEADPKLVKYARLTL